MVASLSLGACGDDATDDQRACVDILTGEARSCDAKYAVSAEMFERIEARERAKQPRKPPKPPEDQAGKGVESDSEGLTYESGSMAVAESAARDTCASIPPGDLAEQLGITSTDFYDIAEAYGKEMSTGAEIEASKTGCLEGLQGG